MTSAWNILVGKIEITLIVNDIMSENITYAHIYIVYIYIVCIYIYVYVYKYIYIYIYSDRRPLQYFRQSICFGNTRIELE